MRRQRANHVARAAADVQRDIVGGNAFFSRQGLLGDDFLAIVLALDGLDPGIVRPMGKPYPLPPDYKPGGLVRLVADLYVEVTPDAK